MSKPVSNTPYHAGTPDHKPDQSPISNVQPNSLYLLLNDSVILIATLSNSKGDTIDLTEDELLTLLTLILIGDL